MPEQPDPKPDEAKAAEAGKPDAKEGEQEQTFTQEDVDRIVRQRAEQLYKKRVGDIDLADLKAKAGEKATADERIAALEQEITATKREALKRRVQAAHSISDEDADLFLTGTDEDTLAAQAKRLAERDSERKKNGNVVPDAGRTPTQPKPDERQAMADAMFGHTS